MSDLQGIDPGMTDSPKRKQFRRAISVSRVMYNQIRAHCEANDRSMSGFVEELVNKALDKAGTK